MFLKLSQKLLRFFFYSAAAIIICMAVALAVLRVALPDLGNYKSDIEKFISNEMGYPVGIDDIEAKWVGWIPNLDITNIKIFDKDKQNSIIAFKEAHIKFDLLSSVSQKTIIPSHIMVNGTSLTFARLRDGSIIIVESGTNLSEGGGNNQALTNWFKQQNNLIIVDAKLTWVDLQNDNPPVTFENTFIELSSDLNGILANGTADLIQHDEIAAFDFKISMTGDITTQDWSGSISLNTNDFDISQIFAQQSLIDINVGRQKGNGQLNAKFEYAKLKQLTADIHYDALEFGEANNITQLEDFNIDLDMLRTTNNQWLVNLEFPKKQSDGVNDPITKISATAGFENENFLDLNINYLPLSKIFNIVSTSKNVNLSNSNELLSDAKIYDMHIQYRTSDQTSEQHFITLTSNNISLDSKKLYDEAKTLKDIKTDIIWNNSSKELQINNLSLQTEDFPLSLKGSVKTIEKNFVDLELNIEQLNLNVIPDYLPKTANEPLKEWVNHALVNGTANKILLTIKGELAKFPFPNDENGKLRLSAKLNDGKIKFHPEWPLMENLDANFNLQGVELKLEAEKATILEASINTIKAKIPDILEEDPNLYAAGNMSSDGKTLVKFIQQSPLKNRESLKIVEEINLTGPTKIDLDLNIPLYPEDLTKIDGTLAFLNNSIYSEELKMQMTDMKGDLKFTRNSVTAKNINAIYFDRNITLSIPKVAAEESEYLMIAGNLDQSFLREQISHYSPQIFEDIAPYLNYWQGQSQWQVKYNLDPKIEDDVLLLRSDLTGLELNYPEPLYKAKTSLLPLTVEIPIKKTQDNLFKLKLAELVKANINYTPGKNSELIEMHVLFGNQPNIIFNPNKIELRGNMEQLDLSGWLDVVTKANEQLSDSDFEPDSLFNNKYSEISVNQVFHGGQTYNNVLAKVTQKQGDWNVQVESNDIVGTINVPAIGEPIDLNLSTYRVVKNSETTDATQYLSPEEFSIFNASVDNFYYNDSLMGKLMITSSRTNNGINIDSLSLKSDKVSIDGYGKWLGTKLNNNTELRLNITADTINDMRRQFQFDETTIENGKLTVDINSIWTGSPFDFELGNLNGDLNLSIEKGTMSDIDPKAGRIFGLLSIQSLPRRLSLDFSDLFGEGLQFDSIKGHFSISDGQAFTNDLTMIGPSANVMINGRTGLVDQDYDQTVIVTPQITGNLPVAGAVFGPIGIGLGAAIHFAGEIFESIPSNINKILEIQYTITGSWDDPIIEEFKSEKTANNQPSGLSSQSINQAIQK